jgi:hypothetical protein
LATYTHDSELQVITAVSLILHISQITTLPAMPLEACYMSTSSSVATASNSGEISASRAQVLLSQPPVYNSCQLSTQINTAFLPLNAELLPRERTTANLQNRRITTAFAKTSSSLICLQMPIPSNGFSQCRFCSFPRSCRYSPANALQLNSCRLAAQL